MSGKYFLEYADREGVQGSVCIKDVGVSGHRCTALLEVLQMALRIVKAHALRQIGKIGLCWMLVQFTEMRSSRLASHCIAVAFKMRSYLHNIALLLPSTFISDSQRAASPHAALMCKTSAGHFPFRSRAARGKRPTLCCIVRMVCLAASVRARAPLMLNRDASTLKTVCPLMSLILKSSFPKDSIFSDR